MCVIHIASMCSRFLLASIALALLCLCVQNTDAKTKFKSKIKGSDSDECWACTDMAGNLCKKEVRCICHRHRTCEYAPRQLTRAFAVHHRV
jgi:hypothetical protein